MIKLFLCLSFIISTPFAFASGPSDREVWTVGSAFTYKRTEDYACRRAKAKAKINAEHVSEDEANTYDEDGFYVDSRDCTYETYANSRCECRDSTSRRDRIRCYFQAQFKCTEWVFHKDQ